MAAMNFGRGPMFPRSPYGNLSAVPGSAHASGGTGPTGHPPPPHTKIDASSAALRPAISVNHPSNPTVVSPDYHIPVRGGVGTLDAYHNLSKIGEGTYG